MRYTFNVGMGMLPRHIYEHRTTYAHNELDFRLIRVCLLARVGQFADRLAHAWKATPQLLHHAYKPIYQDSVEVMVELLAGDEFTQ